MYWNHSLYYHLATILCLFLTDHYCKYQDLHMFQFPAYNLPMVLKSVVTFFTAENERVEYLMNVII